MHTDKKLNIKKFNIHGKQITIEKLIVRAYRREPSG